MGEYKCGKCRKDLAQLEAVYLHERIGPLKPRRYYCKSCLQNWRIKMRKEKVEKVSLKESNYPANIKVSPEDIELAERILKDESNIVIRYLRKYPTVGLAILPMRDENGAVIENKDNVAEKDRYIWLKKRVVCSGVPYACMVAFMHEDKLYVGWSKRLESCKLFESRELHSLFRDAVTTIYDPKMVDKMPSVVEAKENYQDMFSVFAGRLMEFLTMESPKEIEVPFAKKSGKLAAIIRGLNDTIELGGKRTVSAASGPVPHDIARNLGWFVKMAEESYEGKAVNVGNPELLPVPAAEIALVA